MEERGRPESTGKTGLGRGTSFTFAVSAIGKPTEVEGPLFFEFG
jgi:hypothetical protein